MASHPPLVLVHGLWDTPRLFDRLQQRLANRRSPLLIPQMPIWLGRTSIQDLAAILGHRIEAAFGPNTPIDLLGFSMGGLIGRTWIQQQGGQSRTRRFISVGSPQQGTPLAQPWPRWLLAGIADMKLASPLLNELNANPASLEDVECSSFYCPSDLMVVPGWRAVLPVGPRQALPVFTHRQLMREPAAIERLAAELLRP